MSRLLKTGSQGKIWVSTSRLKIWTWDGWIGSTNATSVLCCPPTPRKKAFRIKLEKFHYRFHWNVNENESWEKTFAFSISISFLQLWLRSERESEAALSSKDEVEVLLWLMSFTFWPPPPPPRPTVLFCLMLHESNTNVWCWGEQSMQDLCSMLKKERLQRKDDLDRKVAGFKLGASKDYSPHNSVEKLPFLLWFVCII